MLVLLATFAQVAQEQLTKAVCLKPVFNQVLPCQHTFCTQCLQVDIQLKGNLISQDIYNTRKFLVHAETHICLQNGFCVINKQV